MFTRTSTLRAVMRANERREEALLSLIRNLGDRLANERGTPWTLPPRPPTEKREESEVERLYRETVSL